MKKYRSFIIGLAIAFTLSACERNDTPDPLNPDTAEKHLVDRFSSDAGTLMVRDASNSLPAAGAPIDFDQDPFITKGLGPDGQLVEYYNFDVMPLVPAPLYVLIRHGDSVPVAGQLNIIDQVPGDPGYSDLWLVKKVTVPEGYVANTAASDLDIIEGGYTSAATTTIVNCPVAPQGSTATLRYSGDTDTGLLPCWYKRKLVYYFNFLEAEITTTQTNQVPTSPIYVTFNINPDETGGGPPSGFVTETGSLQTHNVIATIPTDPDYSPFWSVNVYDNTDFSNVTDLQSAMSATILANNVMYVNCPVVKVD
jgi:hypothetical protein